MYPIEPAHGGVSRSYLLSIASARPNLTYEIALHPYYPWVAASFADITEEILVDCLCGKDKFSFSEFQGIASFVSNYGHASADYLLQPKHCLYDTRKRKDAHKVAYARKVLENIHLDHPALPLIRMYLDGRRYVPRAAVSNAFRFVEQQREHKAIDGHRPRSVRRQ